MKTDIANIVDIQQFVDLFYKRVQDDERLGPIFSSVAEVEWSKHLETMYRFWETVIFGTSAYEGNPLTAHLAVNEKLKVQGSGQEGLAAADFDRWLTMFEGSLDELYEGPNVAMTKQSARRMAQHLNKVCARGYRPDVLNRVPNQSRYRRTEIDDTTSAR